CHFLPVPLPRSSTLFPYTTLFRSRLPSADEILDKYVEALGGKAAFEKFSSRVVKGALELPAMGITSGAEIYAKAPNKWLLSIERSEEHTSELQSLAYLVCRLLLEK